MAFLSGDRRQSLLFPLSIEEYVGADAPVRLYDAFVDQLDLSGLGMTVTSDRVGAPEYHPAMMVKLLVYGYAYGFRSSRKLERATYDNVSFIWLTGGMHPDHKTIARFRRTHRKALRRVLSQCARLCLRLGLIEGNTLFVDGTKVAGNASVTRSWTAARAQRVLAKLDARMESILSECEATDRAEGEGTAPVRVAAELANAQSRKERVQQILAELAEEPSGELNTTDRDCRRMKGRQGMVAGYNMQVVADEHQGLLVHADVVTDQNDLRQLGPQITAANAVVEERCVVACGDAGYANTNEMIRLEAQGITPIVPSQDQARRRPARRGGFDKSRFVYDAVWDEYRCPAGQRLRYRKTDHRAQTRTYLITHPSICHQCESLGRCTRAAQGRSIVRLVEEEAKQRFEAHYETPAAQAVYQRRKARVEHPIGHIKWNLGVRSFLLRGLDGVRAEASLLATGFNLKRMMTLWGVPRLLQAMNTA